MGPQGRSTSIRLPASGSTTAVLPLDAAGLGPDLPDGRHVLYVGSDNDLDPTLATKLSAFAIDGLRGRLEIQSGRRVHCSRRIRIRTRADGILGYFAGRDSTAG